MNDSLVESILKMSPVEAHKLYRKVVTLPACPVKFDTLKVWYTPGVAAPCRDIDKDPEMVYQHTSKGNTIAVSGMIRFLSGKGKQ